MAKALESKDHLGLSWFKSSVLAAINAAAKPCLSTLVPYSQNRKSSSRINIDKVGFLDCNPTARRIVVYMVRAVAIFMW